MTFFRVSLVVGVFVAVISACSGSSTPPPADGGVDAGVDAGHVSACGHVGDQGNGIGVGQYCERIADCPASAQICSAFQNSVQPVDKQSYFCTTSCGGCDPAGTCGAGAICVCQGGPDQCGCVPSSCAALIPDGSIATCPADAGTDGGLGGDH